MNERLLKFVKEKKEYLIPVVMLLVLCAIIFGIPKYCAMHKKEEPKVKTVALKENLVETKLEIIEEEVVEEVSAKTELEPDVECTNIAEESIIAENVADNTTTEEDISNIIERESEQKYLLARLVYAEAGGASDEHQIYVASVVLNRMNSSSFPNSLEGVIYQNNPLQYACTVDGNLNKTPDERAIKNAHYVWENGSQLPHNVVYQAEFKQGSGIFKQIGNTYFCYQ